MCVARVSVATGCILASSVGWVVAGTPLPMPDWPTRIATAPGILPEASSTLEPGEEVRDATGPDRAIEQPSGDVDLVIKGDAITAPVATRVHSPTLPDDKTFDSVENIDAETSSEEETPLVSPSSQADVVAGSGDDPVTASKSALLSGTGLVTRQSEISESIIIMERQLRQAELIGKLMELLGPETPIEIAPGEFRSFASTPAGIRIAAELTEAQLEARIRLLELSAREAELERRLSSAEPLPLRSEVGLTDEESLELQWPEPELLEIHGFDGRYGAVLLLGERRVPVVVGETLPDGGTVSEINSNSVIVVREGEDLELTIGR